MANSTTIRRRDQKDRESNDEKSSRSGSGKTMAASRIENDRSRSLYKVLGSGTFGEVYQFEDPSDEEFPVKIIKRNYNRRYDFWGFISEFDILNLINGHPNLIRLIKCCHQDTLNFDLPKSRRTSDPYYFVLESGSQDLFDWFEKRQGIFNATRYYRAKRLALDIALGLNELHRLGIMHRDIKLDNIIVSRICPVNCQDECSECEYRAKIIDFGTATFVSPIRLPCDISTVQYQSPECWAASYYTEKVDIWAYSLILHALLLGSFPCNVPENGDVMKVLSTLVENRVSDDTLEDIVQTIGVRYGRNYKTSTPINTRASLQWRYGKYVSSKELDRLTRLIQACSRFNPNKRLSADKIINHPWFREFKDDMLYLSSKREEQVIRIIKNENRNTAVGQLRLMLKKLSAGTHYYTYRDLVHSIRLFDICNQYELEDPIKTYYLCLYICIKFFSCLEGPVSFDSIYPGRVNKKNLSKLEFTIIREYLNSNIYYPYIYEFCVDDKHYSDNKLLMKSLELILEGDVDGLLPSQVVAKARLI